MLANIWGSPAISVPAGLTASGLPIGLHLMADRHREDVCLRLARVLEQARPWPLGAPTVDLLDRGAELAQPADPDAEEHGATDEQLHRNEPERDVARGRALVDEHVGRVIGPVEHRDGVAVVAAAPGLTWSGFRTCTVLPAAVVKRTSVRVAVTTTTASVLIRPARRARSSTCRWTISAATTRPVTKTAIPAAIQRFPRRRSIAGDTGVPTRCASRRGSRPGDRRDACALRLGTGVDTNRVVAARAAGRHREPRRPR